MEAKNKHTVLIVDDEPGNIEGLAVLLNDHYDLRFAMSGQDALDNVTLDPMPSAILLDIGLPDIDGRDVCRRIKGNPLTAHIPILFVTGQTSTEDEAGVFELGAADFIKKPISAPIVRARLKVHLDLKEAHDELKQIALTDPLTGLYNRRAFDDSLRERNSFRERQGVSIGLLLIDIDHFKQYNDHYGHPEGDQCLRKIAMIISEVVSRPQDLVSRIGGEEFACILAGADMSGCRTVAHRVLEAIRADEIPHESSETATYVTASIGMAALAMDEIEDIADFIQRADQELYRAKKNGRNRVFPQ